MNELLTAALDYARRGWHVFPCKPRGKEPLTPHGCKDATTDPAQIRAWWKRWPQANVAIGCGPSELAVVDLDGQDAIAAWRALGVGGLTPTVVTGKGLHLYFRADGHHIGCSAGRLGPGLDVRGNGGYVLAPPSLHPSGKRYEWADFLSPDDVPLAPFPPALVQRLGDAQPARDGGDGKVPKGTRNNFLTSLGGSLRRRGLGEEAIANVLLAVNEATCEPPLPEAEVARIAQSISRYPPGTPSSPVSVRQERPTTYLPPREHVVVSRLVEVPASKVREEGLAGGTPLEYLPFLGLEGYVIKGWTHLLAGYPKAGKTELLTRLVQQWTDERTLYITEEPQGTWAVRLARLPGTWDHVTLAFALGAAPEAVLERIRRGDESVVVVDTVRSLLGILDETDNSEVSRVLNPFVVACRERGATLLLAHHVRKGGGEHGEGITGGHAFLGVVDIALELLRDANDDRRRKVRGWGRVVVVPELLYVQEEDGTFRPLGSPAQVELEGVKSRVLEVLNGDWQTRKDILAALDEPKPSFEQVRLALEKLVDEGEVERDPAQPRRGATYRYRLRANLLTTTSL